MIAVFDRGEAVWVAYGGAQRKATVMETFVRNGCERWYKVRLDHGYVLKVCANGVTWRDVPKEA